MELGCNGVWDLAFVLIFVYGWQFVISGCSCLFGGLTLVLGLGCYVCVFDFDHRFEDLLLGVATSRILFVGSGVLLLLLGRCLLL